MTPRVSVVVPTYRRADFLDRCLTALVAQDFDPAEYEIVVADDAAGDDTRRQVEAWAARSAVAIRYIPVTGRHGPAAARNAGWRAARAEIIAFTDDDCVPDPRWLKAGIAALAPGVAALWGRMRVPLPDRPTDYERNEAGLERAGFVTANCFCRRRALEDVGGFDERFTMAWREDSDLHFTLVEKGYAVEPAPAALVVHPVRPARWGVSVSQQRKAVFNALLYKKHPALYRQNIQSRPPLLYYAIALALAAAVVGAALGAWSVAVAGVGVWLVLTAVFCARRLRGTSRAPRHVAEMIATSAVIPLLSIGWRLRGALRYRVPFV
jgi:glycosyltransferase involved in cell wall biosynthesis